MSNISAKTILYTTPEVGLEEYSLITIEVNCPYFVWVELLTHKRFGRNASSNRALSVKKNIETLGYYKPDTFFLRGKGMQSGTPIEQFSALDNYCIDAWDSVWEFCSNVAKNLEENGITKEQASRVLPTFKMMKGLVTGTYDAWMKFLELRDSPFADNAMQDLAKKIRFQIENPDKEVYQIGHMHVPFWKADYYTTNAYLIAAGRIARISYNANSSDDEADHILGQRVINNGHLSPIEHIAMWGDDPLKSAICSKNEDCWVNDLVLGWTNLRSWYEEFHNIETFEAKRTSGQ